MQDMGEKMGELRQQVELFEKEVVLSVTKKVENYLRMQGINVILTRDGDYDLAAKDANQEKLKI